MVCHLVCLSVCNDRPAKAAELIEMPFRMWTLLGPGNHMLAMEATLVQ